MYTNPAEFGRPEGHSLEPISPRLQLEDVRRELADAEQKLAEAHENRMPKQTVESIEKEIQELRRDEALYLSKIASFGKSLKKPGDVVEFPKQQTKPAATEQQQPPAMAA